MAKMFVTEEEAARIIGCPTEKMRAFAREGRLREFRDGPRRMYKGDQVEELAKEINPPEEDRDESQMFSKANYDDQRLASLPPPSVPFIAPPQPVSPPDPNDPLLVEVAAVKAKVSEVNDLLKVLRERGANVNCVVNRDCNGFGVEITRKVIY